MAGSASNYLENKLIDHSLGTTTFTKPTSVYLALYTVSPSDSSSGTEATGGSYVRKVITFSASSSGSTGLSPYGIPLVEVPLMPEAVTGDYSGAAGSHGYVELTFPNNRVIGIHRDITVYRQFKPKTDTIEYTQFMRVASNIENADSYVIAKNVKLRTL